MTLETPLEKCTIPVPGEALALSSSQLLATLLGLMAAVQGGPQQPHLECRSSPHSITSHSPVEAEMCCDEAMAIQGLLCALQRCLSAANGGWFALAVPPGHQQWDGGATCLWLWDKVAGQGWAGQSSSLGPCDT